MSYRLLDLFCGAGGAAVGYHRAGFEIVGVDINPQRHYPFEFHRANALEYCHEHGEEFDAIHASPPCQKYTGLQDINEKRWGTRKAHPDLIESTRRVVSEAGKVYIIENVQKSPLLTTIILCGASLGLRNVQRHRHFESNVLLWAPKCSHRLEDYIIGVYGRLDGRVVFKRREYRAVYAARGIKQARELLGIDWMDDGEIQQAIPPAYTEFIGKQLIQYLIRGEK